jgi:hypothetical protein
VLEGLAALTGEAPEDLQSDHGRWWLYERAIDSSVGSDLLLRAVALEEDKALATSVVLRMLELVATDQQATWIDQLPAASRAYSQVRASEIEVLRRAKRGDLEAEELASNIDRWSDWLQLRLAATSVNREGLAVISNRGRTRRIRNAATERLKGSLA